LAVYRNTLHSHRYVKSRNDQQLRGEKVSTYSDLSDCDPIISLDGTSRQDWYLPCGLIAWSMFNGTYHHLYLSFSYIVDTFVLRQNDTIIPLRKKGIAWSSDANKKFKNPSKDAEGIRVIEDFEDEDFIVWMRTAGLPNFKKLYRIIDQDIEPGQYEVQIVNSTQVVVSSTYVSSQIIPFQNLMARSMLCYLLLLGLVERIPSLDMLTLLLGPSV
jgi:hypothetical protein